jgi:hypothetical protein
MTIIDAAEAMVHLERVVAAVKSRDEQESKFGKALATLKALSQKVGIPIAIVGGLAAIHHGYERFTKDIDVVIHSDNLDILTRVGADLPESPRLPAQQLQALAAVEHVRLEVGAVGAVAGQLFPA